MDFDRDWDGKLHVIGKLPVGNFDDSFAILYSPTHDNMKEKKWTPSKNEKEYPKLVVFDLDYTLYLRSDPLLTADGRYGSTRMLLRPLNHPRNSTLSWIGTLPKERLVVTIDTGMLSLSMMMYLRFYIIFAIQILQLPQLPEHIPLV